MQYSGKYEIFNPELINTYPVNERTNKVKLHDLMRIEDVDKMEFEVSEEIEERISLLAKDIVKARNNGRAVIFFTGAHLVKNGLSPLVRDLIKKELFTCISGNGANSIHDFELGLIGETSEYVPQAPGKGQFGMAFEFNYINAALIVGNKYKLGYGESVGKMMLDEHFRAEVAEVLGIDDSVIDFQHRDISLQAYWIMDPEGSEVSVETGLQAEAVAVQRYSPGGAGNVVANVAALKPKELKVIGVIGDDIHGRELTRLLNGLNADTSALTVQKENFDTYTYTKKILNDQEQPRIDFGLNNSRSRETDSEMLKNIRYALENYDVLIFNQQVHNSLNNESFIDEVNDLFDEFDDKIVILDSRHYNDLFRNVYRKVNEIEAGNLLGYEFSPRDFIPFNDIKEYGKKIFSQHEKPVFVSCGSRGIITFDEKGIHEVQGIQIINKIDTVGTGDTTISALALCLAAGIEPEDAATFANFAAAVTIRKLYTTGTASAEEIIGISKDVDYNYRPELAKDIRQATYIPDTEFEVCNDEVFENLGNIKHVIFDNDGTISTLREGWEKIMEPVMIEAILGNEYKTCDKALYDKVRERVMKYIDVSTGVQTIVQMEGLIKLIREFDIIPDDEILDKFAYKKIYNDALMKMVNKRIDKLKKGELSKEDYIIKGALEFINKLKKEGVKLYMASGTDRDDVVNELKELGYAELFDGGIYGSVGDVKKYSKKIIIDKIINENNLKGNELLVVGDGPFEIKECNKYGGIAVGIANDEIRRYGLNEEKRVRLVKAGADLMINDYTQAGKLIDVLFKK